ncbi:MAG: hypothetical protein KDI36_01430 [Pseudomonadales bacterium]|nr:hypothetical protein [Pseudomonadales bacterium]
MTLVRNTAQSGKSSLLAGNRNWYLATSVCYALAAWFSTGFYHFDEHFQILEFTAYLWGVTPATELPWEFSARMRPWLQAFLLQPSQPLGPHAAVLIVRLIMGQLYLLLLFRWLQATRTDVAPLSDSYIRFGMVLWFLPMLAVRYSSEMFSSLLLLSFCLLFLKQLKHHWDWLLLGITAALCFWSRFQLGVFLFFPLLHQLIANRISIKTLILLVGFAVTCMLMLVLDASAYGYLVFTPWHYFEQNILAGKTSNYGEDPPWAYLKWLLMKPTPFVGIPLILGFVLYAERYFRQPLIQGCVAFVLIHFFIAHKELRFLFPMLPFAPLFIWYCFSNLKMNKSRVKTFGIFNLVLLPLSLQPLHPLEDFSRQLLAGNQVQLLGETRPDVLAGGLKTHFFFPPDVTFTTATQRLRFYDRVGPLQRAISEGCQLRYSSHLWHGLQVQLEILKDSTRVWGLVECTE